MNLRNNKGITMVALIITVILMLILFTITINYGKDTIKKTKLESFKTNMLLIEAKAKEYVEKANHDLGVKPDEATEEMVTKAKEELKGTVLTSSELLTQMGLTGIQPVDETNRVYYYEFSTDNLKEMGINGVESNSSEGIYIVQYDVSNVEVEIYNTQGFKVNNTIMYSLSEIRNVE